jgi:phosphoribosyl 1,2-cyclic phosphodiesterase
MPLTKKINKYLEEQLVKRYIYPKPGHYRTHEYAKEISRVAKEVEKKILKIKAFYNGDDHEEIRGRQNVITNALNSLNIWMDKFLKTKDYE